MPVFTGRRQNGKEYLNQICINESFLEPKTWNLGGTMQHKRMEQNGSFNDNSQKETMSAKAKQNKMIDQNCSNIHMQRFECYRSEDNYLSFFYSFSSLDSHSLYIFVRKKIIYVPGPWSLQTNPRTQLQNKLSSVPFKVKAVELFVWLFVYFCNNRYTKKDPLESHL